MLVIPCLNTCFWVATGCLGGQGTAWVLKLWRGAVPCSRRCCQSSGAPGLAPGLADGCGGVRPWGEAGWDGQGGLWR